MAVVLDEFGSAVGIVTLEDIHESVVGEVVGVGFSIPGYVHKPKQIIEPAGDDGFLVDGRVSVTEVNEALGATLPHTEGHTIGGLVMARLRHLPKQGESVVISGYRFTVEEARGRLVSKLRVKET
jgi:putative hemolysin